MFPRILFYTVETVFWGIPLKCFKFLVREYGPRLLSFSGNIKFWMKRIREREGEGWGELGVTFFKGINKLSECICLSIDP